jgi:hypothetical protein
MVPMNQILKILLILISVGLSGCYRNITMIIFNESHENISIEYTKPTSPHEEIFLSPKTYTYNPHITSFTKYAGKVNEETTNFSAANDTTVKIVLEAGNALIIGKYQSYKNREEIIRRYNMKVNIGPAKTDGFGFWENSHDDVLWIRK